MPLYDFECQEAPQVCNANFEAMAPSGGANPPCPVCGAKTLRLIGGAKTFSTIVPTTLKSKKLKAGYVHTHEDRPKTPGRIQVGYTGK